MQLFVKSVSLSCFSTQTGKTCCSQSRSQSSARRASFHIPPDDEDQEEEAVKDNISSLLDSIAVLSSGSVFVSSKSSLGKMGRGLRGGALNTLNFNSNITNYQFEFEPYFGG